MVKQYDDDIWYNYLIVVLFITFMMSLITVAIIVIVLIGSVI